MKTITRCTVDALITGLTKAQKKRLRALYYTDDDFADSNTFYAALGTCCECRMKDMTIANLEQDIQALQTNLEYFDRRFDEVLQALQALQTESGCDA